MLKYTNFCLGLKRLTPLTSSLVLFSLLSTLGGATEALARIRLPVTVGYASYYNTRFHGRCCTANGEKVNIYSMTAAHRSLPFGRLVRVTNVRNARSVVVRINDRGPYGANRIIDLSQASFKRIAKNKKGMIKVRLELL